MDSLYDDTYIKINYEPETHIMFCEWIGFQTKEGIEKAGYVILDLIKQKKITKILNNNAGVVGPWIEATQWTYAVWFPLVIQAGLRHFAWVLSPNLYSTYSARKAMPNTPVIKEFFDYSEAYLWLKSI